MPFRYAPVTDDGDDDDDDDDQEQLRAYEAQLVDDNDEELDYPPAESEPQPHTTAHDISSSDNDQAAPSNLNGASASEIWSQAGGVDLSSRRAVPVSTHERPVYSASGSRSTAKRPRGAAALIGLDEAERMFGPNGGRTSKSVATPAQRPVQNNDDLSHQLKAVCHRTSLSEPR